jgi:hypothetical protein
MTEPVRGDSVSGFDVFVSVGRTSGDQQEAFVRSLEHLLEDAGFRPRTLGRTEFSSEKPLERVMEIMSGASGVVVIALERKRIEQGVELQRTGPDRAIVNERLPTVWNHIEAAMAYVLGLPLLVVVQDGLHAEGLLEAKYDWFVQCVDLKRETFETREFRGVFRDWAERARKHATG